jgi:hypothetical protein
MNISTNNINIESHTQDQLISEQMKIELISSFYIGNKNAYGERMSDGSYIAVKKPITAEVLKKHLSGVQPIMIYPFLNDGLSVHFSALDFDNKKNKPKHAYYFIDVKIVSIILTNLGIPHGIARSTNNGYHIYIYFNEPYPAYKIRSVIRFVFERAGFSEDMRYGRRMLPELFPKQDSVLDGCVGNGIRIPLSSDQMVIGRNCFVDINDEVIKDQWSYFSNIKKISASQMDKIISESDIELFNFNFRKKSAFSSGGKSVSSLKDNYKNTANHTLKLLPFYLFQRVLENCEALKAISVKGTEQQLSYYEGFSLFSVVRNFHSGREWFKNNISGWDKTPEQVEELNKFDCCFHTCRFLQSVGICKFNNEEACLLQRFKNGHLISPSPIRFANPNIVNRRSLFTVRTKQCLK